MKSFRVKNIKSFVDSGNIEIAPITIFVGRNSCGKSSLIRFPAVLSQTFIAETDSPIKFYGKMLDYGNYEDVLHGHGDGDIAFEIVYHVDLNRIDAMPSAMRRRFIPDGSRERKEADVSIAVTISKVNKSTLVKDFSLLINSEVIFRVSHKGRNNYKYHLFYSFSEGNLEPLDREYSFDLGHVEFDGFFPILRVSSEQIQDGLSYVIKDAEEHDKFMARLREYGRLVSYGDYNAAKEVYNELPNEEQLCALIEETSDYLRYITNSLFRVMRREADQLSYIGPFRDNPERVYRDQEKRSTFVGTRGENISTLLINDHHKDKSLIDEMSKWLKKAMGYKISVKDLDSNLFQIMIEDEEGFQSNILDVGYGISQVLPIVAEVFRMQRRESRRFIGPGNEDKILIIEQPELHLHPAAQADLADLFVAFANERKRRLLVETHSEHLIRKLQVCVADPNSPLTKDMIKIYYVDKKEGQNEASITEMRICDDGRFEEEWPSGFFDKAFELSMELAEYN